MTTLEEEAPRLAELNRSIQDFRQEFREVAKTMVRRDVYDANQQTVNLRIENIEAANRGLNAARDSDIQDRKNTRNLMIGIAFPGLLSFVSTLVDLVK